MPKIGSWSAFALAASVAVSGAAAQTAIPPSPKDFVMDASHGDQYEILAARVATVQGTDPRVRAFALDMIKEHTRLAESLAKAAVASGLPAPTPGISSDQASLLGSLQSLRGHDFDKAYARQQALVHAQAAAVAESFATAGTDPNLRQAAVSALPSIQDHLTKARQLRIDLGGS